MPVTGLDASSAVHSRSPSRSPPDTGLPCLFLIVHHDGLQPTQHEVVWHLPPQGDTEGPQSFIFCTAPRSITLLPQVTSRVRGTPQLPSVPSLIPRSRATCAIGFPVS